MEIKSSLVNHKDFALVKDSLIKASEIDGKEKFRVKMLEYINDSADNDDDEFFFDMLEFVRFLNPKSEHAGFTTPDHLIHLNPPIGGPFNIGENVRKWEFIYDHECMHQLWDTFEVGDKIKKEGIKFDHEILNIASDVVINDYLERIRKKDQPNGVWTPQHLKEEYGVEYDIKYDTQYTLYLKLIEVADKLKKDKNFDKNNSDGEGQGQGQGQEGDGQQSQQSSGGGQSSGSKGNSSNSQSQNDKGSNKEKENESAQDAADRAKKAAENAQKSGNKEAAEKAQEAAKEAQEAADKAKEAAKNGDKKEEEKQTAIAKNAADKAEQAAGKSEGNDKGGKEKSEQSKEGNPNGNGEGKNDGTNVESDVDTDELKKRAEEIIEKYKNKISGDLGRFLKQCQSAATLNEKGLMVQTEKGISLWNQQLNGYVKSYVKNKVFKKQREFKRTYQRVKRGSGFVEYGQPIQRGKKLKDDKLIINVAFYVDRSGSMCGTIDNVFDAAYIIAESLKKQFGKEKVVGDVAFKMFTFDDSIEEIKWGKKVQARGGNLSMHEYMKRLEELTGDYLINVFITDGQFTINAGEIQKMLDNLGGCLIYVTNHPDRDLNNHPKGYQKRMFKLKPIEGISLYKCTIN